MCTAWNNATYSCQYILTISPTPIHKHFLIAVAYDSASHPEAFVVWCFILVSHFGRGRIQSQQ